MQRKPKNDATTAKIIGHVHITDDLGNVLLDEQNAVHPQNLARVFARALANEPNAQIYRVALGNGGTTVSVGNTITYKTANDGQLPDPSGWQSRLYNETYSEVIDEQSGKLGQGDGASPSNDPIAVPNISGPGVRSSEQGLVSLVTIDLTLNALEPSSQEATDNDPQTGTESQFMFDELGLFTSGRQHINTQGKQVVNISNKEKGSNTGLAASSQYTFSISVNGGAAQPVTFTTPAVGSGGTVGSKFVTYGDIIPLINSQLATLGATATVTDKANNIYAGGNLIITSTATGPNSAITISQPSQLPTNWLFNKLIGFTSISAPVSGELAGVQNNAADATTVRERLLTHIIFSPILKAANRTIRVVYTLTISVARSQ
jgi:hypothetical protein